jgi:hypothetical protein
MQDRARTSDIACYIGKQSKTVLEVAGALLGRCCAAVDSMPAVSQAVWYCSNVTIPTPAHPPAGAPLHAVLW